jgi:hypothetical protein
MDGKLWDTNFGGVGPLRPVQGPKVAIIIRNCQ